MNDSDSYQRARNSALRLLSYRSRSKAEIRARLIRNFPSEIVDQVILTLSEQSLLDDADFANQWRSSRERSKPRSAAAIKRELISKGVDRETAELSVQGFDDYDAAYRAGAKTSRHLETDDFELFRKKLWGYLYRRGFSPSVAHSTIRKLWSEAQGANDVVHRDSGD